MVGVQRYSDRYGSHVENAPKDPPQRGFLIRRDNCDGAPFPRREGVARGPIFTAARYIRRSRRVGGKDHK